MRQKQLGEERQSWKVFKYCPYCGSSLFEFYNGKAFRCKSCENKWFINVAAATIGLILNSCNEILVAIRKKDPQKGFYDLPGGFIDMGETAEEGITREIKEELNLDVAEVRYFSSAVNQYFYGGVIYHTLDLAFICSIRNFQGLQAHDDVLSVEWINLNEIVLEKFAFPSTCRILTQYLASIA